MARLHREDAVEAILCVEPVLVHPVLQSMESHSLPVAVGDIPLEGPLKLGEAELRLALACPQKQSESFLARQLFLLLVLMKQRCESGLVYLLVFRELVEYLAQCPLLVVENISEHIDVALRILALHLLDRLRCLRRSAACESGDVSASILNEGLHSFE